MHIRAPFRQLAADPTFTDNRAGNRIGRKLADDFRLHVFEMRNLPPEVRKLFQSDMRHVVDYLAEGNSFRSNRPVVHKEALIRLLRALDGGTDVEDTARILEEMNVKEEDKITLLSLVPPVQYAKAA